MRASLAQSRTDDADLPLEWFEVARTLSAARPRLRAVLARHDAERSSATAFDVAASVAVAAPGELAPRLEALPSSIRGSLPGRTLTAMVQSRRGDIAEACATLDALAHEARDQGEARALAWIAAEAGRAHGIRGDVERSVEYLEEAHGLARRADVDALEIGVLINLGMARALAGDTAASVAHTQRGRALALRIGDSEGAAHCLINLADAHAAAHGFAAAEPMYAQALAEAEADGFRFIRGLALGGLALSALASGDLTRAGALEDACQEALTSVAGSHAETRQALRFVRALLDGGHVDEARARIGWVVDAARASNVWVLRTEAHELEADVCARAGDLSGSNFALRAGLDASRADLVEQRRRMRAEADRAREVANAQRAAMLERVRRSQAEERAQALSGALARQEVAQRLLEEQARTDELTRLPNRRGMRARLDAYAQEPGSAFAVALVDVDRFKRINDTYGHPVGDEVLVLVAERLTGRVRGADAVARWGGEEFCVLIHGVTAAGARSAADGLRLAVANGPVMTSVGPVAVSVSIGVAVATADERSPDGLLRDADAALYRAKSLGRDRVVMSGA